MLGLAACDKMESGAGRRLAAGWQESFGESRGATLRNVTLTRSSAPTDDFMQTFNLAQIPTRQSAGKQTSREVH